MQAMPAHLVLQSLKGGGVTFRGDLRQKPCKRFLWMALSSTHSAAKDLASATIARSCGLPRVGGKARTPAVPTWLLSSVL
jgi:hypothetical protein